VSGPVVAMAGEPGEPPIHVFPVWAADPGQPMLTLNWAVGFGQKRRKFYDWEELKGDGGDEIRDGN
jgi:hypothetical protein